MSTNYFWTVFRELGDLVRLRDLKASSLDSQRSSALWEAYAIGTEIFFTRQQHNETTFVVDSVKQMPLHKP